MIARYLLRRFALGAEAVSDCDRADADPAPSSATDTPVHPGQRTAVQRLAVPWLGRCDGESGFSPLARGGDALNVRLRLIDAAEHSIDLQSFLIRPDLSSRLMAGRLVMAADRGVRVRILVDDIFTSVADSQFAALAAHRGIEVRIFNPLPRGMPRPVGFLAGLPRSNRRMHNKSFIVDSAVAIVGGRNNADEYFEADERFEFADLDVLGMGPVVAQVSAAFDLFWNCALAVAPRALRVSRRARSGVPLLTRSDLAAARRILDDAAGGTLAADLSTGRLAPVSASARVVTDRPDKLRMRRGAGERALDDALHIELVAAQREVVVVTPYFVPRADDVARFRALRERGVRVTVITNSLASTNHPAVHGGYAPHRRALLGMGVRLYEARPDTARSRITGRPVRLTLHAKAVVIDRGVTLVGSLNVDPRSVELNTEMGIFIHSRAFASRLADRIEAALPHHTYALRVDHRQRMVWDAGTGDGKQMWTSDPRATFWRKLVAGLVAGLPFVKNQL